LAALRRKGTASTRRKKKPMTDVPFWVEPERYGPRGKDDCRDEQEDENVSLE
jgi:hypothetical protein